MGDDSKLMQAEEEEPQADSGRGQSAQQPTDFPVVVGIGASAGGLEAFTELLAALSDPTGMAFVLIQHLDPQRKSLLVSLLGKSTRMPVLEAEDDQVLEADRVYVIPPGNDLALEAGRLKLLPRESRNRNTIDTFFESMADHCGPRCVGIILTGMSDDGARGIEAVKAGGGITFAQDESARYESMPRSATATGCVDFVLPLQEIARKLVETARHPLVASAKKADAGSDEFLPENQLAVIYQILRHTTGVDFAFYKQSTIRRRIMRRLVLHKLDQVRDYVRLLHNDPKECKALYEDFLIHVTHFFRDPDTYEALRKLVFPAITANKSLHAPLRIWVPGCSSGEQVYSLAISLLEFLQDRPTPAIQIFGTDISEASIERARNGLYAPNTVADLSPERLARYFVQQDDGYRISRYIRDLCVFARQNVVQDPPFSKLDLIWCSNVLIYMGPVLQKRIVPIFHYALNDGGYLVLGTSETIGGFSELFSMVSKKNRIYTRRPSRTPIDLDFRTVPSEPLSLPGGGQAGRPGPLHTGPENAVTQVLREAERVLLSRYVPPGALINGHGDVIQFHGRTGRYLEPTPGPAATNLYRMAREGLGTEIRDAVAKARALGAACRSGGVAVRTNDHYVTVNIEVIPVHVPGSEDRHYLVSLEEEGPAVVPLPPEPKKKDTARQTRSELELERVRRELDETRQDLQAIIEEKEAANEELKAANEEIQSANEELQSTNEELQTAKEELQSTNEELTTINEELGNRNADLSEVNNDLTNLLYSINLPIIMLDRNLRIRRFTPMAEQVFNIIPTDVGRPITDIKPNVEVADLDRTLRDVIQRLGVHDREVRAANDVWYSMRIRPYQTADNKIDGAVIALVEVDAAHNALIGQIQDGRGQWDALMGIVPTCVLVLDENQVVESANQQFHETFRLAPEDVQGRTIYNLGDGQWDIASLHHLLEKVLKRNLPVRSFELEHEFSEAGIRKVLVNATRIPQSGAADRILVSLQPIQAPAP